MKKETIEGSKNLKPKLLGATPLQISEEVSAWLVGGIVEKGFSENQQTRPLGPSAPPRPSVMPFPVARHRSHGPHWCPKVGNFNVNNDDDDDADMDSGREEDLNGMEVAADVANPVRRKDKKSLDFSRWQEIMNNDGKSVLHWKEKEMKLTGLRVGNKVNEIASDDLGRQNANPEDAKLCRTLHGICAREQSTTVDDKVPSVLKDLQEETEDTLQITIDDELPNFRYTVNEKFFPPAQWAQNEIAKSKGSMMAEMVPTLRNESGKELQMDSEMQHMPTTHVDSGYSINDNSFESQIDAENRARLAKMSADEIAEAQAEIMAKLKPELINSLKKRSQEKAKKLKFSLPEVGTGGEADSMQHAENLSKLTVDSDNSKSHKPVKEVSVDIQTEKENKVPPNMSPKDYSSWNAWSKRVELVRTLRFSLDGDLIDSDITLVSETGNASSQSGYSADTVSERDFLRTEGDPGAAGYTIKEAVALTRSVVPGQRTLAFHLIASVLDRAICCICQDQVGSSPNSADADWEAVWAFALGPEPELALSLRMSLDDNHNSVILACAKAIQCALSCGMNEIIFDILEKASTHSNDVFTAPVFRSKPDINVGFLRGGFWKYNTKPSNIVLIGEESDDKPEGDHTIQDDIVVAGQDIAAGLVRMGILPRICYLLETDPSAPLEECLISILIAIARHSPTCAAAIMNCERLVQTVANRFTLKEHMEINSCKIKSVMLLKVLARLEKKSCLTFIKNGIIRQVTWHLYRYPFSLDQWVKSGKEACKCLSTLLVEQLRLWKACINYGFISEFSDLLASVCMWLSVPSIELLIVNDVMNEYFAITKEVYLLLDVLAGRLPNFFSVTHEGKESTAQDKDSWSWSHIGPIIDLALEWINLKSIPYVSRFFGCQTKVGGYRSLRDSEINSLLWVISSVLSMLSSVLKAVIPEDTMTLPNGNLPWLPHFVPKIGLEIIKNGYMGFFGESNAFYNNHPSENGSVVECLFHLRCKNRQELAISSTCFLKGLIQVVTSVDKLIQLANLEIHNAPSKYPSLSREDKILGNGILKSSVIEIRGLLTTLMTLITNEWQCMQPIEVFGRGGPAPGVGMGWGASGGGYWSLKTLLAQQDVRFFICLLEVSEILPAKDPIDADEISCSMQSINCALAACLIVGPGNSSAIDKLLNIMFQVPVLKYLDFGIRQFLCLRKGLKPFEWNYEEEEYLLFANVLATHFRNRWLSVKKKSKAMGEINHVRHKISKKGSNFLETIYEDMDPPNTADEESSSLILEWAYQRLHLPVHWFLSAISTIHLEKNACPPNASYKFLEVTKGGLFFLLGIEAISTFLTSESYSPVKCVPVVWKLHALSVILLSGMSVLEDEKSRDIYETLQNVYGEILDEKKLTNLSDNLIVESLQFESDIHENYSTFIETLVEQFAAESYGDMVFGRQVAIYLHRSVEASVRLATWNALSNARALELLPPLDQCLTKAEGYLEPIEDDERILESYVKSWVYGALDKAATRSSAAFSLVLHHLSVFIFGNLAGDMLSLHNKLVKSLLRDYSHKQKHEGMVMKLILYKKPATTVLPISEVDSSLYICEIERRLQVLKEICVGNSMLMATVEKLESCIRGEFHGRTLI